MKDTFGCSRLVSSPARACSSLPSSPVAQAEIFPRLTSLALAQVAATLAAL